VRHPGKLTMMNLLDREQSLLANPAWRRKHSWWVVLVAVCFVLPPLAPLGFAYPATRSRRAMWWPLFGVLVGLTVVFYVVAAALGHGSLGYGQGYWYWGLPIRVTDEQGWWVVGPYLLWAVDLVLALVTRPVLLRDLARAGGASVGPLTSPAATEGMDQFPVHDAPTWPTDR